MISSSISQGPDECAGNGLAQLALARPPFAPVYAPDACVVTLKPNKGKEEEKAIIEKASLAASSAS